MTYLTDQTLWSPFTPQVNFGTTTLLQHIGGYLGDRYLEYSSNGSGELTKFTFPHGGYLRWDYTNYTFVGSRTMREVSARYLLKQVGAAETAHVIWHGQDDSGRSTHWNTVIDDYGAGTHKVWWFTIDQGVWYTGLVYEHTELGSDWSAKRVHDYSWVQDAAGNPYIAGTTTTIDYGTANQKQSRAEQTLDTHGNVTQAKVYDYGNLSAPARTYDYTYLSTAPYTSKFMFNRLATATLTAGGQTVTLVTNTYDSQTVRVDIPLYPPVREWVYPRGVPGNLTRSVTPGKVTNLAYNTLGQLAVADDGNGHSVSIDTAGSTNYAAPSAVTPMGNPAWAGGYSYDAVLNVTQATGPNGTSESAVYNVSRPTQTTAPDGAVTTYEYHDASPAWRKATINGRWTKSSLDGFGRTIKVEIGDGAPSSPVTKSVVDTEYAPCACSPLGKLYRTSQPYAPGGAVYWTTYSYDALGRTISVAHPNGTGTTTYAYQGNTVTVTDPAGKWKTYTLDVFGNIMQVTEPRPAGGTYETYYTYDGLSHLTNVSMTRDGVTQTRTFVYDAVTQRLTSTTNPENGTVTYLYNADGTLQKKTDARGQWVQYGYDANVRLTSVNNFGDPCQAVTYYYDTNPRDATFTENGQRRVTVVEWGGATCTAGAFSNWYSYTPTGHMTKKKLRVTRWVECCDGGYRLPFADLDDTATYDNEGRMATRGNRTYGYDTLGRLNRLTVPVTFWDWSSDTYYTVNIDVAKDVLYGPAGEMTQIRVVNDETVDYPSYSTETRQYNARFQLTRRR